MLLLSISTSHQPVLSLILVLSLSHHFLILCTAPPEEFDDYYKLHGAVGQIKTLFKESPDFSMIDAQEAFL